MRNNSLKVTVALVCYQEKQELAHILQDLRKQSAFENIAEVLLFQNGNCKQTRKTAESFFGKLPLKIISSLTNNLGLARAELVNKSQYDLIAFTDSDCRLPNNWLEELLNHWSKNPSTVAVGGPNRLPEKKVWQTMLNLSLSQPLGHGWSPQAWIVNKKTKVSHIPTTNGLFLKQAILSVGNFSKKHKKTGEDLDLGLRLKKKGDLLLFPSPNVINNYASTYFESLKRLFVFGKARSRYKNFLFYPCLLFFPSMSCFFILGIFQSYFFLLPLSYFLLLFLASLSVYLKSKQEASFLLPLFWFLQHLFYSLGANFRVFLSFLNKDKNQKY